LEIGDTVTGIPDCIISLKSQLEGKTPKMTNLLKTITSAKRDQKGSADPTVLYIALVLMVIFVAIYLFFLRNNETLKTAIIYMGIGMGVLMAAFVVYVFVTDYITSSAWKKTTKYLEKSYPVSMEDLTDANLKHHIDIALNDERNQVNIESLDLYIYANENKIEFDLRAVSEVLENFSKLSLRPMDITYINELIIKRIKNKEAYY
jgi:hypothetical protein